MQKYLLMNFIIGLFIGIGISGLLSFKFFNKKMIEYKKGYNNSKRDNVDLKLKYRKKEKKLVEYENKFHDKYVDDGYDAF